MSEGKACLAALLLLASQPLTSLAGSQLPMAPSLDPPKVENPATVIPRKLPLARKPTIEWTYHKSSDGSHPDGTEQQIMWLMNRARQNPTVEGEWLATESDPDVADGRTYFNVDLAILRSEFAALAARPPAAFDVRLYTAALAHSLDLISRDAQDHTGQFDRIDSAGFHYSEARGSVFSYADSGLNCHAAWNIDWGGNDGTGMQTGRGHRMATMSGDGDYTNVGIAAVAESDPSTSVGPLVVTGNYAKANSGYSNHHNLFIVGTVWQDKNGNDRYDPGEGLGNVTVMPDSGTYYAVTADSGGYAIPITAGTYQVTFSGGSLGTAVVKTTTVDTESVLLDLIPGSSSTQTQESGTSGILPLNALLELLLGK